MTTPNTDHESIAATALDLSTKAAAEICPDINNPMDPGAEGARRRAASIIVAAIYSSTDSIRSVLNRAHSDRDEAIKAHGLVWNAVRRAASALRWLGIPAESHKELAEDAGRIFDAEKLTPKWSIDWAIISRTELEEKDRELARLRAKLEADENQRMDDSYRHRTS